MITKEKVAEILAQELADRDLLLVDLAVNNRNKITVVLDARQGVSIEDCSALTRLIESALNRDEEDYELEVASAGVGQPLKLQEQYAFNVGRLLSIFTQDGVKHSGTLTGMESDGILVEVKEDIKEKGKKKKTMLMARKFTWEQIKLAKIQVSFK
jgi:ribosome maturation factor RimP